LEFINKHLTDQNLLMLSLKLEDGFQRKNLDKFVSIANSYINQTHRKELESLGLTLADLKKDINKIAGMYFKNKSREEKQQQQQQSDE